MKLYWERILIGEVPERRARRGELFTRLVAVNVSSDGNWEPVYMPLVKVQRGEGTITIWVNDYKRPRLMIFLTTRWPFVSFFKYDWVLLEEPE